MKARMFTVTALINKAHLFNEMRPFIVYGPYGYGKTAFSIKVLAQVYGKYDEDGNLVEPCYDWHVIRNHLFFHPKEFIDALLDSEKIKSQHEYDNEKIKCIVWDDAGFWLYSLMWYDRFVKAVGQYMNVARTHFSSIIFTTPSPNNVIKKIRGLPQLITVKIMKASNDRFPSQRFRRIARGYRWWRLPDMKKQGVKPLFEDRFSCKLPDDIYEEYMKMRSEYADYAVLMMKKELEILQKDGLTPESFIFRESEKP